MNAILRCYIDDEKGQQPDNNKDNYYDNDLVFCYDVESSVDEFQNLLTGYYSVWSMSKDIILENGLFHGDLKPNEYSIMKSYAKLHKIPLMNRDQFAARFLNWGFYRRSLITGFNIGFDLSRISLDWGTSKSDKDAFSFKISEDKYMPRIFLKHLDSKRSFINFVAPYSKNRRTKNTYSGCFVDLRTLCWAITSESHSLDSACKHFGIPLKSEIEKYGVINSKLISYNINDVKISYLLLKALMKKLSEFDIPLYPHKLSSTASLLKNYWMYMGVQSFTQQNPTFNRDIIGYTMSSFYGAKIGLFRRRQIVDLSYVDFLSMYPSQMCLQKMWRYVVANSIEAENDNQFEEFVNNIKLKDLANKETWSKLQGIALVELQDDYFPLRAKYGNKTVHNIGVNYISGKQLWYAYPDIIASKIRTGRTPKIIRAIRFVPQGLQPTLKPTKLFGMDVDPRTTDFIKLLIEHRLEVQEKLKTDQDNEQLKTEQHFCKIMANSLYGVGIETNTKPKQSNAKVYGLDSFKTKADKTEHYGRMFNPIISTLITSGARLILAMSEAFVGEGNYFYEDTDAIFIKPSLVEPLQAFFKPLNPYNKDVEMFKVEKGDNKEKLDNVKFIGVSSKRYALAKHEKGKIIILKHSSHGLGGITSMPEGWEIKLWQDIIKYNEGLVNKDYIELNYGNHIVAGKLAITSPFLLRRFNKMNGVKNLKHRIRPFSFVTVGIGYRLDDSTKQPIIPMLPYTEHTNKIKYMPFVDYKTGKIYSEHTEYYWKPMSELFFDYINHKEEKFEGNIGLLKQRHVKITGLEYIGKESNSLEESETIGVQEDNYVYYSKNQEKKITERIETLTLNKAKQIGMKRWQYNYIKRCLKQGRVPQLKKKTLKLLGLL